MDLIKDRYTRIQENIQNSCVSAGRPQNAVKLIVVIKKQPIERIIQVVNAGAEFLGENYPEDIFDKITLLPDGIKPKWHMIGHIQSRKIKILVQSFSYIQSIDRISVARKLNQACTEANITLPILLQVNLSGEESKQGFSVHEKRGIGVLSEVFDDLLELQALSLCGLMTMPPLVNKPEDNQPIFARCRNLLEEINGSYQLAQFDQLSMGTSQDYSAAIEEGATMVRVGEAIMGKR